MGVHRSPDSSAAQALAQRGATLIEGDLDDPSSIRAAMAGVAAVFSVQTFMGPAGVEGQVHQGKAVAKAAKAAGIRQVVDGQLLVRLPLDPAKPLQMLATADIGVFAADAFGRRDQHIGTALALAGDELTGPQIAATFAAATGLPAAT